MFSESLYPKTKQVLELLLRKSFLKNFYLAGGTALALHLGHRKSIDLDFFASKKDYPKIERLNIELKEFNPKIISQSEGTLDVIINDVKVSFLEYDYPLLETIVKADDFKELSMASVLDIACMKITAISSRGSKKDFVDMYFILQNIKFDIVLKAFYEKYKGVNYSQFHILKSLLYFEDAEKDPDSDFLNHVEWRFVKSFIEKEVVKYLN